VGETDRKNKKESRTGSVLLVVVTLVKLGVMLKPLSLVSEWLAFQYFPL